jgi:hypothetical protein
MKKINAFLILFIFPLWFGCESIQTRKRNIVCLIDFSNSITQSRIVEYAEGIKIILSSMGPEDKLAVYPIDAGSITDRVTIMYEDFRHANGVSGMTFKNLNLPDSISPPFKKPGEDNITATVRKARRLDGYLSVISPLIVRRLDSLKRVRTKYGNETDIFSAIFSVKDDFEKQKDISWLPGEKTDNYLIIFSDLVQESSLANFNTKNGILENDYDTVLQHLKDQGLVCNLQQAKVIVYDSYSNSEVSNNSMAKVRIRGFWDHFFSDSTVNAYSNSMKYQNSSTMDDLINILNNY